ncbi:hypothetical protein [Fibrella aquatica]|uniref:hypothetical protein n=1 Tax=Fibrella aquatica TaxID=3242487 RepID=UPI003520D47E
MIIDDYSVACKRRICLIIGLFVSLLLLTQDAWSQCTYLLNTDFEDTQIGASIVTVNQSTGTIAPWRTTARDGAQEIWRSGFNGVPSYSGNQFIELNANVAATTFQNFVAPGGTMFTLNFAHRGRSGVDVMNVSIGSPSPTSLASGTAVSGTTYLNLGNFSDGNTAWGYYTVSFTLPTGVANNAFSIRFTSVSAAGGNTSVGNFLDAISIADLAPTLNGSRTVTLACPQTTTSLSGFTPTNQPAGTIQTWHTGAVATDANRLSSVTAVGPGTYYTAFYNSSKACYGGTTPVIVNGPTGVPSAPTIALVQPVCTLPTGTITILTPLGANLTYSIDGINYSSNTIFAAVPSGTYTVRARNGTSSLCTSAGTTATINAALLSPPAPTATVTAQPTCTLATGTITVTAPTGLGITYSIDGTNFTSNGTFTGVAPGVYAVIARNATGCISVPTSLTVNPQPTTPAAPTATVTAQPNCTLATGTITVTAPTEAGLTYSINGTSYTNTTGVFTGLAPGVYPVTVRNTSGCTSTATSVTVNPQPATPVLTVNSATICAGTSAPLTVSGCTGGTLRWSTTATSTSISVLPLATTTYSVTCTGASGCSATASTTITVRPTPSYSQQPTVTLATCTGATPNSNARITFTTLQNTERADIVSGSTYGSGPTYGAVSNRLVASGSVSFSNLPNPAANQPYTVRLFSPSGLCSVDVTTILRPTDCRCPGCPKVQITPGR